MRNLAHSPSLSRAGTPSSDLIRVGITTIDGAMGNMRVEADAARPTLVSSRRLTMNLVAANPLC